ncbi:hypothetical protein GC176_26570 [bacterium]|nr:hypothetical protein [bacterium]
MPSVQVRDILSSIQRFYHELASRFRQAQKNVQGERLPYLLQYIAIHEGQLGTGIEEFEENADMCLLNTWLQFGAEESLNGILQRLDLKQGMTEDEILAAALQVDTQLIRLYDELAGESSVPRVRELFEALSRMQEARERQLARAVE